MNVRISVAILPIALFIPAQALEVDEEENLGPGVPDEEGEQNQYYPAGRDRHLADSGLSHRLDCIHIERPFRPLNS